MPKPDTGPDERMALARRWDQLVDAVRSAGYDDFLRPLPPDRLLPAAEGGPVITVNVSKRRCDALIVRTSGVTSLPLPDLTWQDIHSQTLAYLQALDGVDRATMEVFHSRSWYDDGDQSPSAIRAYTQAKTVLLHAVRQRDDVLTEVLGWLWQSVTEPVLEELGITGPPTTGQPWPRVWWCPTGLLTLLPLHAAGHHNERDRNEGHSILDRAVSSYAPSLRALADARRPVPAPRTQESMLIVAVPEPPGQAPLAEAERERDLLRNLFTPAHTLLQGEEATVESVRSAMARSRWAHFCCHGGQNLAAPSQGGLILSDGVLTIADISTGQHDGDFAFLSACMTAVGGVFLPDEAVTLTAALWLTGYRHVIGTLWSVHDRAAADLAALVYTQLTATGTFDPENSALALHSAVRRLRDTERLPLAAWLPFTHTGP